MGEILKKILVFVINPMFCIVLLGVAHALPVMVSLWQDISRTYTPGERSLDNLFDCRAERLMAA